MEGNFYKCIIGFNLPYIDGCNGIYLSPMEIKSGSEWEFMGHYSEIGSECTLENCDSDEYIEITYDRLKNYFKEIKEV